MNAGVGAPAASASELTNEPQTILRGLAISGPRDASPAQRGHRFVRPAESSGDL